MKKIVILFTGLLILVIVSGFGKNNNKGFQETQVSYHVSPKGSDNNPGTISKPFKTISNAASIFKPGDTCFIHEGRYPETVSLTNSGNAGKAITYTAYNNEKVIIDGRDKLAGLSWKKGKNNIWSAKVSDKFQEFLGKNDAQKLRLTPPLLKLAGQTCNSEKIGWKIKNGPI